MGTTLRALIAECTRYLAGCKVDSPGLSARCLAEQALSLERLQVVMEPERPVDEAERSSVLELVRRRGAGEPLAYILGTREFYGLDFRVTPDVLIPRPETEHIVEEVERHFPADASFTCADFGTGSGILAVTIASVFPGARVFAVDISPAALEVARDNARSHGVAQRITFVRGDMRQPLFLPESLDLLVSNPPYVTEGEYQGLSHEVSDFEPQLALVSPGDGLEHLRALAPHALNALRRGGRMYAEFGCLQGRGARMIFRSLGVDADAIEIVSDLAGLDRIVGVINR